MFFIYGCIKVEVCEATIAKMIVPSIKDDCLMVRDNVVLSHVPRNITVAPAADEAAFIGAASSNSSFRVFSFGVLEYV